MSCSALSCRPSYPACPSPSLDFSFLFLDFSVSRSLGLFLLSLPPPSLHPPSSLPIASSPPAFLIDGRSGEKQPPAEWLYILRLHPSHVLSGPQPALCRSGCFPAPLLSGSGAQCSGLLVTRVTQTRADHVRSVGAQQTQNPGAQTPARTLPTQDARPLGLSLEISQFVFLPSALLSCPSLGPEREEAA